MKKPIIYIILSLIMFSCSRETLSENSVVDSNIIKRNQTELDIWINQNITLPYGISVEYRWDGNAAPRGNHNYPPNEENVKAVLETIKALWIDLYNDQNVGKANFLKGKNPLKIYLYGGRNVDANGVELLGNNSTTNAEMHLYNVNDFDPKNPQKVFILMRSVHHQFARRLAELIPYDRDAFVQISQNRYLASTDDIADVIGNFQRADVFKVRDYANKRGFYTLHSFLSAEEDFAEIISATLTHTPREIATAVENSKTPHYAGGDTELQQRYDEEAKKAHKEFTQKQTMVDEYFSKKLGINLKRMQLISVQKINAYTK